MFKKLSTLNPLWLIIPGVLIGLGLIAGAIGSIYLANTYMNPGKSPFSQRYVVNENKAPAEAPNQNQLMAQMQQMQKIQNMMMGNTMSMNMPAAQQMIAVNGNDMQSNVKFKELPDKYIVKLLDLNNRKFKIDLNNHAISIKMKSVKKANHSSFSSTSYNSYTFNEPVDVKKLKKETSGDNLVLVIPKINPSNGKQTQTIR